MTDYGRLRQTAERLRKEVPVGTRIELIEMEDDPNPVSPGIRGTVIGVDDAASIMVDWDNGRSLSLIYGVDRYRALTNEEIDEEVEHKKGLIF
jgi:hypothetical protein